MEYRVARHNPAPYNDADGKISLLGLGTMRLPLRDPADPMAKCRKNTAARR